LEDEFEEAYFPLMICMMFVREMLVRRYPPLLVDHELVAIIIGKLYKEVGKVNILEESFLGMLIVAVAWVTYEWLVLIVCGFTHPNPLLLFFILSERARVCSSFLPKVVCALSVAANVHISLNILQVKGSKTFVDLSQIILAIILN
jgi:hypothetical protein